MGAGNSKQALDHCTKEQIGEIVASYGAKYEGCVKDAISNGVDGPLMASLGEDNFQKVLDDLDITSRMHRRKLVHVFRSAQACSSVCSQPSCHASASAARPSSRRKPRNSITSISSFLSEATISETEDYSSHNNSRVIVFDVDTDQEPDSSQCIIEEFQLLLDKQFQVNQILMQNVERLEEQSHHEAQRKNKLRPPQDQAVIVLTDVADSTRLWEACPRQMREAIDTHDKIIRRLAGQHLGYEIDTEGDSFQLCFHEASDAVAFALTLQEKLNDATWSDEILVLTQNDDERRGLRARVAISMGQVESMPNAVTQRTQ